MKTPKTNSFSARLATAVKRAASRLSRGNVNLTLGRFVTEREIRARIRSAASALKAAK